MSWIISSVVMSLLTFFFPSVGFIWGFCFGFSILFLCSDLLSTGLFFVLPNSWMMVDYLSILMEVLVVVVFMLSLSCSVKDFYFFMSETLKSMESMLSLVSLASFFFFFVGGWISFYFFFECTLFPILWMIMKWGYQPERLQAGITMFIYLLGGSLPLLMVLVFMFLQCSSDSFILSKMSCNLILNFPSWVWGFALLGFLIKVPIYGFHGWLPQAHVEAPLAGSMVLAGVLLKLGGFGLIRIMWSLNMVMNNFFLFVVSFSLWGGLISTLIAVVQCDIKCLIAYSSVGHMSLVVGSVMSCYPMGKMAGECMMFAHGICSPCMFALAAVSYELSGSRNIMLNGNMLSIYPLFTFFWFVFSVANMGCPPSLNYFSEVFMFTSLQSLGVVYIIPMGMMCHGASISMIFLYGYINHGGVCSVIKPKSSLSGRYLVSFLFSLLLLFLGFTRMDFFFF